MVGAHGHPVKFLSASAWNNRQRSSTPQAEFGNLYSLVAEIPTSEQLWNQCLPSHFGKSLWAEPSSISGHH